MKHIIILFIIIQQSLLFGQFEKKEIDTVFIKKNESKIGYKIYKRILLPKSRDYSFNTLNANHQDSLIFTVDSINGYYFKILNKKGKLKLEGERAPSTKHLFGDVKFYNNNADIKRIEHWKVYCTKDSLNTMYYISEGPIITSIKKYRKGKFTKEISYGIDISKISP